MASAMTVPTSRALIETDFAATRWLHVDHRKREHWYDTEPIDAPVMEVKFARLDDGSVWQVCARRRVKLHDRFSTELYPPPHGRGWRYAGPGYIAAIYARPAPLSLLRRLRVKP